MSSRVRVGNLSPAKQQKIIANVRAGQAAYVQLNANLRREEKLMNNIHKLNRERVKVMRLLNARPRDHPENSNSYHRNTLINARLARNINRRNQEITRHKANLVAIRRRLMGRPTQMTNRTILVGVNYGGRKANINRVKGKRLARAITGAYLKGGGMYSRKLVNNVQRIANSKRN